MSDSKELAGTAMIRVYHGDDERLEIVFEDDASTLPFLTVKLTREQLGALLVDRSDLDIKFSLDNVDKVGLTMEHQRLTFPLPAGFDSTNWDDRDKAAHQAAIAHTPEGWSPPTYFGSQTSFFTKDDEPWAAGTIRRWV